MQPQDDKQQTWQQPPVANPQAPYVPQQAEQMPAVEVAPVITQPTEEQPNTAQPDINVEENIEEADVDDGALVRWQSSEVIHPDRSVLWFVVFGIVVVGLILVALLLMNSPTFAILVPVMAAALIIYIRRPAGLNDYTVSRKGIHINDHLFTYEQFKSFGIQTNGANHAVVLVPRKRFQIGQTLNFPEEVGEALIDMLAERLPMNDVNPDFVDKLITKLRL